VPRTVKGFQVLEWQKPSGARNEPLDLKVYCLAMLELVKRRYNRATMWDQLEAQVSGMIPSQPAPPTTQASQPTTAWLNKPGRSGWLRR
jgi:phage terminase large subunit GpA-like protein